MTKQSRKNKPGAGRPVTVEATERITVTLRKSDIAVLDTIADNRSAAIRKIIEEATMKNETTYYVHEDMLGDIGTEAQARRMVEFLRERGYNVEYGQTISQDSDEIADQDWYDGLDVLSAEMVE